jgi:hypothetical protein
MDSSNVLDKVMSAISSAINSLRGNANSGQQGADSAAEAVRQLEDIKSSVSASNSAGVPALVAQAVTVVDSVQKTAGSEVAATLSQVKETLSSAIPAGVVVDETSQVVMPILASPTNDDIVSQGSAAAQVVIGDALAVTPESSSSYSVPSPKAGWSGGGGAEYSVPGPVGGSYGGNVPIYSIPSPVGGGSMGEITSYSVPAPVSFYSVPSPIIGDAITVAPSPVATETDPLANLQPRQMPRLTNTVKENAMGSRLQGIHKGSLYPVDTPVAAPIVAAPAIPAPEPAISYSIPAPINGSGYVIGDASYSVPAPVSFYSVPSPMGGYTGSHDVAMFPPPVPPAFTSEPGLNSSLGKTSPI